MSVNIVKMSINLAAILGLTLALQACNTTAGAGKDIEKAGDAIHDSAQKHKSY